MPKHTPKHRFQGLLRGASITTIFLVCGTASFMLGLKSVGDISAVKQTIAQAGSDTMVNVILQYQPSDGGGISREAAVKDVQSALLYLQEIHTGRITPANTQDRCRTTNSLGRCSVRSVPVGPDPLAGIPSDQQYDILVDTVFIEFLTGIALDAAGAYVRFDQSKCSGNATSFSGDSWCLTKPNNAFAVEYFVTITLNERDDCRSTAPPASFCDASGKLVSFECNPSTSAPTRPWEPVAESCDRVQCPDGNFASGVCADITPEFSACSTAEACKDHLLCSVTHFGSSVAYNAGTDTIVIRGLRFGNAGGTVEFPTDGNPEVVEVFPGPDWTDTEIRVRVPRNAISGVLKIHPHTHGFLEENDVLIPVTCSSPPATIRAFKDQFAILALNARSQDGVRLVAPGHTTEFQVHVRHNDAIGRLTEVQVELLNGSFPNPDDLPVSRTVIAQTSCPATPLGSPSVKEGTLTCALDIPDDTFSFRGPFTFLVTVVDDQGGVERGVLLDAGESALAGDFNLDGYLSIDDAVVGRLLATGALTVQPEHILRDTNQDEVITMDDVIIVLHTLTQ